MSSTVNTPKKQLAVMASNQNKIEKGDQKEQPQTKKLAVMASNQKKTEKGSKKDDSNKRSLEAAKIYEMHKEQSAKKPKVMHGSNEDVIVISDDEEVVEERTEKNQIVENESLKNLKKDQKDVL